VAEDVAYLRAIGSPLADQVRDFGADARIPPIVERIRREGSAVLSRTLTSSASYWAEVHGALDELERKRVSALDGLEDDEARVVLEKSNIIECDAGDRVLKKGGVARNMFVVLEGTLEVRDGADTVAVLAPGDVFGEMAFLLERPRSRDVYAATDGVRVLSLSESNLRELIASDAPIAAQLLLNVSKMLCIRLLKRG
jgi:CRP-like cAMP-binding protein